MDLMSLKPGFNIVGLTLHVNEYSTLAFADTHLGYEEALNKQGVLVPHFQYADIVSHIREAVSMVEPERIVINGDLKHEFGGISRQEWDEVLKFLDELKDYDVTLVRGNHDTVIGPIADRKGVKVVEELRLGTTLFVHGHKIPEDTDGIETIVVGHEHPCIGLREEGRVERVKSFLAGEWEGLDLIVLPSLNFLTEGVDVTQERLLSPLLRGDIRDFRAYGVENGEIMYFGTLNSIFDKDL
ncbi:MAG: metallophosphoesterase [Candidatus Altiarchaeota archaeon]